MKILTANLGLRPHMNISTANILRVIRAKMLFRLATRGPVFAVGFSLILGLLGTVRAADIGRTFATPEEAVAALSSAVQAKDTNALQGIFGPAWADVRNPDRVQAASDLQTFAAALEATNHLEHESDTRYVLDVGEQSWPFPIPLVKLDGKWFFDTQAGEEEILDRRIGKNELETLQTVRAYVAAQREYASRDRDGSQVLKYAQRLFSSPGTKDGLYWPA